MAHRLTFVRKPYARPPGPCISPERPVGPKPTPTRQHPLTPNVPMPSPAQSSLRHTVRCTF